MVRNTAREIAIHLSYELSFTDKPVEELLDERLTHGHPHDGGGHQGDPGKIPPLGVFGDIPVQLRSVVGHAPAPGGGCSPPAWRWASPDTAGPPPPGASINEAVEIAKKYETPETVKFINGILGTFVRRETAE